MCKLVTILCLLLVSVFVSNTFAAMTEDFESMGNGSVVVGQNGWQKMNYWGGFMPDLYIEWGTANGPGPGSLRTAGGPFDWSIGAAGKAITPDAGSGNVYTLELMINPGADGDPVHIFLGNSAIVDNVAYPDADSINNAKARAQLSFSSMGPSGGSQWLTTAVNGGAVWEQHATDYQWPPESPRIPLNWVQYKMVVDYAAGTTSSYWRDVNDATGLPIGSYIQMASLADVPAAVTHVGVMMYGYTDGWAPEVDNIVVTVTPEPATVMLLSLGFALLRRHRK